jgi:DNA repair exonuclease SbcCD ATPase subunit
VRITRLAIHDLRRYRDTELELAPGLTVVRGPNEAGKSTLQRAIELALTRRVTATAAEIAAMVPWDGGPEARTAIDMDFTWEDDEGGRHAGHLEKVFRGAKGTVRLALDDEIITDPARADEALAELSGVPTEAFFRSTASVRHHELDGLARDEAALRDRLQASISGADRGTSRAKRKLDNALRDLRSKGGRNPGRLKTAEDAVADGELRLRAGEEALVRLERDREALTAARDRRAEADRALVERRSLLEKARQAERLLAERDAARQRFERYQAAVALRDELAELDSTHPSTIPLPALRADVERLRSTDTRIATLESLLEGEVHVDFDLAPESQWRSKARLSLVLVVVGLLVAAAGLGLRAVGILSLGLLPPAAGLVIAVIGAVFGVIANRQHAGDRMSRQLAEGEVNRRLRGRSDMEEELRIAKADREVVLARLDMPGTPEAEERLAAEDAHVGQIEQGRARLNGLVGDESLAVLPDRRSAAALEIEQKSAALEGLGPIAKEPRARERLEVEVTDAERMSDRARDDEANARARVEQNPVDAEEVAGLSERLAAWRTDLEAFRRRERVYARTLEAINSAEQATMQRATRYLERRMVVDVARVTGGRYRRVRVDDTDLGIEVMAPERGDWVPVTDLSQGTLDVVYLAARLGLVRLVTGDRRPPLIFDDPFVTLDDDRAARALELLREVSADFQVIYLTTSTRYDAHADAVVVLAGPVAVDTGTDAAGPAAAGATGGEGSHP